MQNWHDFCNPYYAVSSRITAINISDWCKRS